MTTIDKVEMAKLADAASGEFRRLVDDDVAIAAGLKLVAAGASDELCHLAGYVAGRMTALYGEMAPDHICRVVNHVCFGGELEHERPDLFWLTVWVVGRVVALVGAVVAQDIFESLCKVMMAGDVVFTFAGSGEEVVSG